MKIEAMLWVLILVSTALAIGSRKYRWYGVAVIAAAILAIVAAILLAPKTEMPSPAATSNPVQRAQRVDFEKVHIEKLDREDPEARNRIAVSEIRFDQISPSTGSEPGTFESVRARLHNDSARFTLTDFAYYLVVQDCMNDVCTTIYDQRGRGSTAVPANQARDVMIRVESDEGKLSAPFKVLGTLKIVLSPTEARAYQPGSTP